LSGSLLTYAIKDELNNLSLLRERCELFKDLKRCQKENKRVVEKAEENLHFRDLKPQLRIVEEKLKKILRDF
jgi:hypothetical protein